MTTRKYRRRSHCHNRHNLMSTYTQESLSSAAQRSRSNSDPVGTVVTVVTPATGRRATGGQRQLDCRVRRQVGETRRQSTDVAVEIALFGSAGRHQGCTHPERIAASRRPTGPLPSRTASPPARDENEASGPALLATVAQGAVAVSLCPLDAGARTRRSPIDRTTRRAVRALAMSHGGPR